MLKLPSAEPAWLDLVSGVRVFHKPASPTQFTTAFSWARTRMEEAAAQQAAAFGVEPTEDERNNAHAGFLAIGLARLCITAWEGVDAEFTPANVEALMQVHGMPEAYLPAAMALVTAARSEGNGSAPAPNGTTAGAPDTAKDAETQG